MTPKTQLQLRQLITNPPPCIIDDDAPLLAFSDFPQDSFDLGDAFEGVAIFGQSGSGKTSGSGKSLAKSYLRAGFGGIVLCAKPDEADTWERYAAETGRSDHIIRFDGSGRWRFNFLEYALQRDDIPVDVLTANLVSTLLSVVEVTQRAGGLSAGGGSGDKFWQESAKDLLTQCVDFLYAATGRVRIKELVDFLATAPRSPEQLADKQWQESSFFYETFAHLYATGGAVPPDDDEAHRLFSYWENEFPAIPDNTRGGILQTLRSNLAPLLRGTMRKLFSTDTNVVPELTHDGAIILLDFPLKRWEETGILAQMIFKYLWMKSAERREGAAKKRPLFLWGDEAQLFMSGYDMEFQSTARSARASTVLLTQNLSSFYSRIGGQQPEHTIDAMMGNLRTRIFHLNTNMKTNQWATDLIGKETIWRQSFSVNDGWNQGENSGWTEGRSDTQNDGYNSGASRGSSYSTDSEGRGSSSINYGTTVGDNTGSSTSVNTGASGGSSQGVSGGRSQSMQEHREYAVEPHEFGVQLRSGGKKNDNTVTGVVVLPGRLFERNGKHWMMVAFDQGA
jgi:hypothetical protein